MFSRHVAALFVLALFASCSRPSTGPTAAGAPAVPSDAEIRAILVARVDTHRHAPGIVAGVIDPAGRRVIAHGRRGVGDERPLDEHTVFEIGSITKVLTSLLLADAVLRGEVSLTDPVAKYLPPDVRMPERDGRQITLQDLAMHTSGLPRLPGNMPIGDPANPYADFTVELMYSFLSGYQLTRDIGAEFEYSNLGTGLLGHALARHAGMDYEALVRERITGPLGMTSTVITLTPALQARAAVGHDISMQPAPFWDLPAIAGTGALRSTAHDMLMFLEAALGYRDTPLASAFALTTTTRWPVSEGMEMGLGWFILKDEQGAEIIHHPGGTGGFRTWAGYDPRSRAGVVLLANASTFNGPDDIGRHLLNRQFPLAPWHNVETEVDAAVFDRHVGRYQLAPDVYLTISRNGDRFLAQLTGGPEMEIFAESDTRYFFTVVEAQLTFEIDADGKTTAVVLHEAGIDQRAARIE